MDPWLDPNRLEAQVTTTTKQSVVLHDRMVALQNPVKVTMECPLRWIKAGRLYETTSRSMHSQLLLRPSGELNTMILGIIARGVRKYGIDVNYFIAMSKDRALALAAATNRAQIRPFQKPRREHPYQADATSSLLGPDDRPSPAAASVPAHPIPGARIGDRISSMCSIPRASRKLGSGWLLPLVLIVAGCSHGHIISTSVVTHTPLPFDFEKPGCSPTCVPPLSLTGDGTVQFRYLGVSGVSVEWMGQAILLGPFFSNPGLWRVGLGKVQWDREAIAAGLQGVPLGAVAAILVGHSHYDHLGDIPIVAEHTPHAVVFANATGANLLAAYPEIASRTRVVNPDLDDWTFIESPARQRIARFRAVRSQHAPQLPGLHWATGRLSKPIDEPWTALSYRRLKEGQNLAFLIDLLDPIDSSVLFRFYYQDAANVGNSGIPAQGILANRPVDLAILCAASHDLVDDFPVKLLSIVKPRHVLVAHYDDFFRDRQKSLRFVARLSNGRADQFLEELAASLDSPGWEALTPEPICGPASDTFSMPIIGDCLRFPPPSRDSRPKEIQ
ncbi:MAG: hypothetical protein K8J08_17320 [Thermoanaerobaculia bacterium]|nr:hypothetical protein [Thermoanaerobaculia bacterium]